MLLWLVFSSHAGALYDLTFLLLHLLAFLFLQQQRYVLTTYYLITTISLQITVGTGLFVGAEAGFQYYLLCLPALTYLMLDAEPPWRVVLILTVGLGLLAICELWPYSYFRVEINEAAQRAFYFFNLSAVLAINYLSIKFYADESRLERSKQQQHTHVDPDTGLLNQRFIRDFGSKLTALCAQTKQSFSLILIRVDSYQQLLQSSGIQEAHAAITLAATCLQSQIKDSAVLARYEPDTFLILLPTTPPEQAEHIATKLNEVLQNECLINTTGSTRLKVRCIAAGTQPFNTIDLHNLLLEAHASLKP